MPENSKVKIPVASHGLHTHKYNFPYLGTGSFLECFPVYMKPLEKGESDHPRGGVYSLLQPLVNAAFVTGRYTFRGYFVPSNTIYKPYYHFRQQIAWQDSNGSVVPNHLPQVTQAQFSQAFLDGDTNLFNAFVAAGTSQNYDIVVQPASGSNYSYYILTDLGSRVMKVLMSLGCTPTFDLGDTDIINLMPVLAYIKLYYDHIFPNQYYGSLVSSYLGCLQNLPVNSNVWSALSGRFMTALALCTNFSYDESIFDNAFDTPVSSNSGISYPVVSIQDITNLDDENFVSTGTLSGGTPDITGEDSSVNAITKFILDSLNSLSIRRPPAS